MYKVFLKFIFKIIFKRVVKFNKCVNVFFMFDNYEKFCIYNLIEI